LALRGRAEVVANLAAVESKAAIGLEMDEHAVGRPALV
jgi:hypothetical protein